jgi:hypothetical protein
MPTRSMVLPILATALLASGCADALTPPDRGDVPAAREAVFSRGGVDPQGRRHHLRIDTTDRRVVRWEHDVDGQEFARLRYHVRANGTLEKVTGTFLIAGQRVPAERVEEWVASGRLVLDDSSLRLLGSGGAAFLLVQSGCWQEATIWGIFSAALSASLFASPVSWPTVLTALGSYAATAYDYYNCVMGGTDAKPHEAT